MSAHPQLTKDEAIEMVKYILSLADENKSKPLSGEFLTDDKGKAGTFIFSASYSDKGSVLVGTQSAIQTFSLRSAKFKAITFDENKETMNYKVDGLGDLVIALTDKSHIAFNDIDLEGVEGFSMMTFATDDRTCGGNIELRLDAPDGVLVGSTVVKKGPPTPVRLPFDKNRVARISCF
ncbi:MAG: hypothetical protein HC817_04275 [Saprospiraceae bacterium]|nr:hypothetical protein [Saprospiraceae bacterium]